MAYSIIVPSRSTDNAIACVRRILQMQPTMDASKIIVVDDGISASDFIYGIGRTNVRIVPGEKPFVYARNCNIGIAAAGNDDVILMNDDALLETPGGFDQLQNVSRAAGMYAGLLSPAVNWIGNENQNDHGIDVLRADDRMLCFVCVYVPRSTINEVGLLDERFVGYGMDDDDYSFRVRQAGLKLAIYDPVRIDHKTLESEFRGRQSGDFQPNLKLFIEKWGHDNRGCDRASSPWAHLFPEMAAQ